MKQKNNIDLKTSPGSVDPGQKRTVAQNKGKKKMKEQKLEVFEGDSSKVNSQVDWYIQHGWRVVKFESRVPVYAACKQYEIILTVLFER